MMKKMNSNLLNGIVAGRKKYIETGEGVNKKTFLELGRVVVIK
jgi:hypothetical protein